MAPHRGRAEDSATDANRTTGIIAEYTIGTSSYQSVLSRVPGMQFTLEQVVACDPETVSVTFWAENGDFTAFETAVQDSESITNVSIFNEQTDGTTLYQVWVPAAATTYWKWTSLGGVFLTGKGSQEGWKIQMRFPSREALISYRNYCKEQDIKFSLEALYTEVEPLDRHHAMTKSQSEVVTAAIGGGYFDVPRGITIADLAARFDISNQAASERLRRGLSNILSE